MTQTTGESTIDMNDIYTPEQITRLATLQAVSGFIGTAEVDDLIDLADFIIGYEDEERIVSLFGDHVEGFDSDLATAKADREGFAEYFAAWERKFQEDEGAITVSDLAGFATLPHSAILEDTDGDTWTHIDGKGWTYVGLDDEHRIPSEIFKDYAESTCHFTVTNPEVLRDGFAVQDTPVKAAVQPQVESVFALDAEGLDALPDKSIVIGEFLPWQRSSYDRKWAWGSEKSTSEQLLKEYEGHLLVLYVPGDATLSHNGGVQL